MKLLLTFILFLSFNLVADNLISYGDEQHYTMVTRTSNGVKREFTGHKKFIREMKEKKEETERIKKSKEGIYNSKDFFDGTLESKKEAEKRKQEKALLKKQSKGKQVDFRRNVHNQDEFFGRENTSNKLDNQRKMSELKNTPPLATSRTVPLKSAPADQGAIANKTLTVPEDTIRSVSETTEKPEPKKGNWFKTKIDKIMASFKKPAGHEDTSEAPGVGTDSSITHLNNSAPMENKIKNPKKNIHLKNGQIIECLGLSKTDDGVWAEFEDGRVYFSNVEIKEIN